jgi:hypothetical protein
VLLLCQAASLPRFTEVGISPSACDRLEKLTTKGSIQIILE